MAVEDSSKPADTALMAVGVRVAGFLDLATKQVDRGVDRTLERLKRAEDSRLSRTFISEADAIESAQTNVGAQMLLYVIAALIVFALVWSIFGKVEKVVAAPGKISTSAPQVAMQAYSTSRISSILVNAGDHVTKGQTVARFDPTFAHADQSSVEAKSRALKAEIQRIQAELNGDQNFPANPATDTETAQQAKIFTDQMAQYNAQLAVWKNRADGFNSSLQANRSGIAGLHTQLGMADKVVAIRRHLVAQQAGAQMDVMIAESSRIDAEMRLKSLVGDTQKVLASRAENEADRTNFINKWHEDLNQRLVAARTELASAEAERSKAGTLSSLSELRAPSSGTVLEVMPGYSVGSILKDGETLVTMVPDNSPLFVQAEISPRDLANLHPGQPVRVKLDAYPYQVFGGLNGHLRVLGADSIPSRNGEAGGQPVYRARIELDDKAADLLRHGIRILPGLTARVEIVTGRRTVASYVFNPILGVVDESLREP